MNEAQRKLRRMIVIIGIAIPVALLHFITGRHYSGPCPVFVNGYLIDILLPFACYFIMCNIESSPINRWWIKSLLVFVFGCAVEISQYLHIPIFGKTFDPLDFMAYGAGVLSAAIVDTKLFPRIFAFWKLKNS